MNLSYWEYKSWFSNVDFTIVGSGIVGLNCALALQEKYPKAKILILEKGFLPQGASTKNAGFACFGSISEILADMRHQSEEKVAALVQKRWNGIQLLRKILGDTKLDFQAKGGHELFLKEHGNLYEDCLSQLTKVNDLLQPVFEKKIFVTNKNIFGFNNIQDKYITNLVEAQINTGKMMKNLLQLAHIKGVQILNGITVDAFTEKDNAVSVHTNHFEFTTTKLFIATNGFASKLVKQKVLPARAQVVITKPIKNLSIKGTFHFDEGYYYFRNIDNRILFGGGRHLDFKAEETTNFGQTELITNRLNCILKETILPNTPFEIDRSWSGIMGVGSQKQPIVKQISDHVFCGVRLGGMGIAIGSLIGKELADFAS